MKVLEQKSIIDKCQIFTPDKYAKELLDYVGYKKNLFGKKIIENSCGEGGILNVIIERYIQEIIKYKDLNEIKLGLENDIYAIELDKKHYETCLKNINQIASKYGIRNVKWNLFNENTLKKKWSIKFDYIVGNPPYIAYRDNSIAIKNELRLKYKSCIKGRFDYCYAFIEESLNCLAENGKLAYLIPNSIFKNVFGEELRKIIKKTLVKIIDYKSQRIFKNALTTSAIIICNKSKKNKVIEYFNVEEKLKIKINKKNLEEKWIFNNQKIKEKSRKFGDYFNASMSVATLYNKGFVLKNYSEDEKYIYLDNSELKIEKKILKKGSSPSSLKKSKFEYIIFPYFYNEHGLVRYSSDEFEKHYPETRKYLLTHYEELMKRNSDVKAKWYEYGRTQALQHLNQKKILLSSLITDKLCSYILDEDYIPYSGIYIIKKSVFPLVKAKEILESDEFYEYVKLVGKNANGKTLKITAKDINDYCF
ncbi:MAG: Eco57I restriction-modification methylase domain-containing protein [Fusobacteriaceae bacterium]